MPPPNNQQQSPSLLTDATNTTYFQANQNLHQTPAGYMERGRLMAAYISSFVN